MTKQSKIKFEIRSPSHPGSFTLIEILAVVAIIAVLIGLMFPIYTSIKNAAKKAKARQDMGNLKVALLSYRSEYGYWPATTSWTEMSSLLNGNVNPYNGAAASGAFYDDNNPKAIRFLEFKADQLNSDAAFIDPWKTPYIVLMDYGLAGGKTALGKGTWTDQTAEDGSVRNPTNPATDDIQAPIAIYSCGPNTQDENGNADDIATWK